MGGSKWNSCKCNKYRCLVACSAALRCAEANCRGFSHCESLWRTLAHPKVGKRCHIFGSLGQMAALRVLGRHQQKRWMAGGDMNNFRRIGVLALCLGWLTGCNFNGSCEADERAREG